MNRACNKPTTVYELVGRSTPKGKKLIVSQNPGPGIRYKEIPRPCNSCIACRVSRRLDLAVRLSHEAVMHEDSWFFTLTYDEDSIPYGQTAVKRHCQSFMKALRKRVAGKVRFFITAEYGGETSRPHYHGVLFGPSFSDKEMVYEVEGIPHFRSDTLDKAWGRGLSEFTTVSPAAMMYVTKYHVDKVSGPKAEEHYSFLVEDTGEIVVREREFALMSNRPGIGGTWFERYWRDVYPKGYFTVGGLKYRPPAYYDYLLEKRDPEMYAQVKAERLEHLPPIGESFLHRLEAREVVGEAQAGMRGRIGNGYFATKQGVSARELTDDFRKRFSSLGA
jgi:hypothetical protein